MEIIVFSKDRPLQLTACLTSLKRHCKDLDKWKIRVLYKASSEEYKLSYQQCQEEVELKFYEETDFNKDLRRFINSSNYVMFVVDDTIFVYDFDTTECLKFLEKSNSIGVSLRLGLNTNYCYPTDSTQQVPILTPFSKTLCYYEWPTSYGDFNYAMEVSSSIYRSDDIKRLISDKIIENPNTLEHILSLNKDKTKPYLGVYRTSRGFSIPYNSVQTAGWINRHSRGEEFTSDRFHELYKQGKRIDVAKYDYYLPRGCHEEVELYLTKCEN